MSTTTRQFNPFPGLRPFNTEEDYLFFGREEQVTELLKLLRQHRFTAVATTWVSRLSHGAVDQV